MARGEKATPAPKPGASKKATGDAKIAQAAAGQSAAKAKAPKAAAASPKTVDRSAAALARASETPCEAAAGPKTKPRQCNGVGVVERKVGKRKIRICAAHVLAKELRPLDEALSAAEKAGATA
jgi:hypothetical protein